MGITSLKLVERVMYSTSVVDIAVIVCILEAHVMGAPTLASPNVIWKSSGRCGRRAVANFRRSKHQPNNQNATARQGGLLTLCLWRTRGIARCASPPLRFFVSGSQRSACTDAH